MFRDRCFPDVLCCGLLGCSFRQTVSPGQSLSISVLFLAREEGSAIGNLVLETSVGGFLFQVTSTPSRTEK